jgi:hypothetical protein
MEIMQLSEEDMKSTAGGGKSWDHNAIQDFLQKAYNQVAEEDNETVIIGIKLSEIADEWYDGTLQDLKDLSHTNPNVNRVIRSNLAPAGFDEKSTQEKRKWAVGSKTQKDGEVVFKVELTPK